MHRRRRLLRGFPMRNRGHVLRGLGGYLFVGCGVLLGELSRQWDVRVSPKKYGTEN